MRVPEPVGSSVNAYLAFRAALLAVVRHNASTPGRRIRTMVVPGLCSGIDAMDPRRCAAQMRIAYDAAREPGRIPSFDAIWRTHHALRSS